MFSIILCKKQAHSSTTSLQNPAVFHPQRAQHQEYTNWVTELETWKTQPFHYVHLFNCSVMQTSNQPVTWQCLSAFRHVDDMSR